MEILKVIKSRRSVMPHLFNDYPIEEEELNKVLESANWAPTHKKLNLGDLRFLKTNQRMN